MSPPARKKFLEVQRHFRRADPALYAVMAQMEPRLLADPPKPAAYFARLCREIISQQLAGAAADAIHARFVTLFLRRRVTPAAVLALSEKKLRRIGMSWAKARSVRDLAVRTLKKEVRFSDLQALGNDEAILELTKVKGIGRWTAEMFLIFTLGREDVFSMGDLGLRKGLAKLYGARRGNTNKHVQAITSKWAPYRSYACLALWHAVDSKFEPH